MFNVLKKENIVKTFCKISASMRIVLVVMVGTLFVEGNLLGAMVDMAAVTSVLTLPLNKDRITSLTNILHQNKSQVFTVEIQNAVYKALQKTYNARQQTLTELTSLQTLLKDWVAQALLSYTQNTTISTTWLPTIVREISVFTSTEQARTIALLKDPKTQIKKLSTFLTENAGVTLADDTKTALFTALQNIFSLRAKIDLTEVETLFKSLPSNFLKSDQTATVNGWMIIVTKELADVQIKQRIKELARINDVAILAVQLPQLLTDNAGNQLDSAAQNTIFNALQKMFIRRSKDVPSLTSLQALLTNWFTSNLLNQAHNTTISSQWLPALASATGIASNVTVATAAQSVVANTGQQQTTAITLIPTAGMNASDAGIVYGINNALQLQDPIARLDALTFIFNSLAVQTVSTSVRNAYAQALQAIITTSNMSDSTLQKRSYDLLQALLVAYLLGDVQKTFVKNTILPYVGSPSGVVSATWVPSVNVLITKNIAATLQQQSVESQINSLIIILKSIGTQLPVPTIQNAFASALQQVATNGSNLSVDQQRPLIDLLTLALGSNLLTQEQKNYINRTLLSKIGLGSIALTSNMMRVINPTMTAIQNIDAILLLTDQATKIDALRCMLASLNGNVLDLTIVNNIASAVQQVFTTTDLQDIGLRDTLFSLLNQTQGRSVLSSEQQKYVATSLIGKLERTIIIPTDSNIAKITAMTSPSCQIEALLLMVKGAVGKTFSEPLQARVATLINDLNTRSQTLGVKVLRKFYQLLEAIKISPLITTTEQELVSNTLSPKVVDVLQNLGENVASINTVVVPTSTSTAARTVTPASSIGRVIDIKRKAMRRVGPVR